MRKRLRFFRFAAVVMLFIFAVAGINCQADTDQAPSDKPVSTNVADDGLKLNPDGIPYATTFQVPVTGLTIADFCFGFGQKNVNFCVKNGPNGCEAYGHHLGQDSCVAKTPVGTVVVAAHDAIVRITTNTTWSGYGSDTGGKGCAIVMEGVFPNGQRFTSVAGHVQCDYATPYDPVAKKGNPKTGQLVKRGEYIGLTANYWHGAGQLVNWPHIHWGMRIGSFLDGTKEELAKYVRGYAPKNEFSVSPQTGAMIHPEWLDPLVILQANGDPISVAAAGVKHLPSGTLLKAPDGTHWLVLNEKTIAQVTPDVMYADRYDSQDAVKVSQELLDCYSKGDAVQSQGKVWVYVRPGTNTVVIAYEKTKTRYDFIRWEAFLSWGFSQADIVTDAALIATLEKTYTHKGYRQLRPGSLVKADEESEVSAVTMDQTRRPIFSGDVFEKMYGPNWQRVVSVPKSVITAVAGPREDALIDLAYIQTCAVEPPCPGGDPKCGGGGSQVCAPKETQSCPCPNGLAGSKICSSDGQFWGNCVCPNPPPGGTGGSSGTGGAGGSTGMGGSGGSSFVDSGIGGYGGAPTNDSGSSQNGGAGGNSCSCVPGSQIVCACLGLGLVGIQTCQPDCASYGACQCPDAGSGNSGGAGGTLSNDGGLSGQGGAGGVSSKDAGAPANSPLHLFYKSPFYGPLHIEGWWKLANGQVVSWHVIAECVDVNPADNVLECDLPVPSGAQLFEFQMYLPGQKYWGDQSCDSGGCGKPLGELTLTQGGNPVSYAFKPNNSGPPYYNGLVAPVP